MFTAEKFSLCTNVGGCSPGADGALSQSSILSEQERSAESNDDASSTNNHALIYNELLNGVLNLGQSLTQNQDQIWIDLSNKITTAAFFGHVRFRHFDEYIADGSTFLPQFQSEGALYNLAVFAANKGTPRPGNFRSTLTYTVRYPRPVGRLRGSGTLTHFLTFIVINTLKTDEQGRRVFRPKTLFSGKPND